VRTCADNESRPASFVDGRRLRRASVLFEVVLSVALFGGAAVFALSAARSTLVSLDRMRLQQVAIDLAKSKMAELEAGLISLADLRDTAGEEDEWAFDLQTSRTEFTDLTLVELIVRQNVEATEHDNPISFTLRQLVAMKGAGE
jgi:hypothetical protein